jgi:hypothetical protein
MMELVVSGRDPFGTDPDECFHAVGGLEVGVVCGVGVVATGDVLVNLDDAEHLLDKDVFTVDALEDLEHENLLS